MGITGSNDKFQNSANNFGNENWLLYNGVKFYIWKNK